MRRRRRRRFYWLPTQGIAGVGGAESEAVSWDQFVVPIFATGGQATTILDVTFDQPPELGGIAVTDPMANFLRSGYMLRRVVGNVFCHIEATSNGGAGTGIQAAAVTYAQFVARAEEDAVRPIDSATNTARSLEYGPQTFANVREPFLFHRNWILGHGLAGGFGDLQALAYPQNNAIYGSAFEGTFVDQKTLRRIDGDNRLWHCVQVRHFPFNTTHDGTANVIVTCMLRYLGRPATASKSGTM